MLRIFNNLAPFFEDCYTRINVREYAKLVNISPPTASKLLSQYTKEGLLIKTPYRNNLLFHTNIENKQCIDLSRIYWSRKLRELIYRIEKKCIDPTIILFGSLAKAETKSDSDVDLAIFAHKKEINTKEFEKKLHRDIQIFWFSTIKDIKSKELANNILNGYVLKGRIKI